MAHHGIVVEMGGLFLGMNDEDTNGDENGK